MRTITNTRRNRPPRGKDRTASQYVQIYYHTSTQPENETKSPTKQKTAKNSTQNNQNDVVGNVNMTGTITFSRTNGSDKKTRTKMSRKPKTITRHARPYQKGYIEPPKATKRVLQ